MEPEDAVKSRPLPTDDCRPHSLILFPCDRPSFFPPQLCMHVSFLPFFARPSHLILLDLIILIYGERWILWRSYAVSPHPTPNFFYVVRHRAKSFPHEPILSLSLRVKDPTTGIITILHILVSLKWTVVSIPRIPYALYFVGNKPRVQMCVRPFTNIYIVFASLIVYSGYI
jgi:hypothetical protein